MWYNDLSKFREIDCKEVAQLLGLTVTRKGKMNWILCPEHLERLGKEDEKPTNCIIDEKGYHCFACGAHGDAIELVRHCLGYSWSQALDYLAQGFGIEGGDREVKTRDNYLKSEDLDIIGLHFNERLYNDNSDKVILGFASEGPKEDEDILLHKGEKLLFRRVNKPSIRNLPSEAFRAMVVYACQLSLKKYNSILEEFKEEKGERVSQLIMLSNVSDEDIPFLLSQMREEVERRRKRILEILEQFKTRD